jgi:hypothetical protein
MGDDHFLRLLVPTTFIDTGLSFLPSLFFSDPDEADMEAEEGARGGVAAALGGFRSTLHLCGRLLETSVDSAFELRSGSGFRRERKEYRDLSSATRGLKLGSKTSPLLFLRSLVAFSEIGRVCSVFLVGVPVRFLREGDRSKTRGLSLIFKAGAVVVTAVGYSERRDREEKDLSFLCKRSARGRAAGATGGGVKCRGEVISSESNSI